MLKNFASLLCTAMLLLSATFLPTVASASTVNYELAANPTAAMEAINSIGTPLSDEMAREIRGENISQIGAYLYLGGVAVARIVGGIPVPVVPWPSYVVAAVWAFLAG